MTITSKPTDGEAIATSRKGPLGDAQLVPTEAYLRFFDDLAVSENESLDATQETGANENQIAQLYGMIGFLKSRLDDLEHGEPASVGSAPSLNSITVSSYYTALAYDDITAVSGAEITLPEFPGLGSVIVVRNGDGSNIVINGNGKGIYRRRVTSSIATVNQGTTLEFRFNIDLNGWVL